jgi:aryl-alcohol dehydrogenase-like predicted oxidoreductase
MRGSLDEAWDAMETLQREGKVRLIGIASCIGPNLVRLHRAAPVASLTAPYSLLRREVEPRALPFCEASGIGFLACSTLASGLLTGKMTRHRVESLPCNDWRRRHPFFREVATTVGCGNPGLRAIEALQRTADREGRTPAQVAVGWVLGQRGVTGAIVGARRPAQVEEIAAIAGGAVAHAHAGV